MPGPKAPPLCTIPSNGQLHCKVRREPFYSTLPVPEESPAYFMDSWFCFASVFSSLRGEEGYRLTEAYTVVPGSHQETGTSGAARI